MKGKSLNQMIASGQIDPDSVTTVGDHEDLLNLMDTLRKERKQQKLSLKTVAIRMGQQTDAPALSRLERGINNNPTIHTITNYARAIGYRIMFNLEKVK